MLRQECAAGREAGRPAGWDSRSQLNPHNTAAAAAGSSALSIAAEAEEAKC